MCVRLKLTGSSLITWNLTYIIEKCGWTIVHTKCALLPNLIRITGEIILNRKILKRIGTKRLKRRLYVQQLFLYLIGTWMTGNFRLYLTVLLSWLRFLIRQSSNHWYLMVLNQLSQSKSTAGLGSPPTPLLLSFSYKMIQPFILTYCARYGLNYRSTRT